MLFQSECPQFPVALTAPTACHSTSYRDRTSPPPPVRRDFAAIIGASRGLATPPAPVNSEHFRPGPWTYRPPRWQADAAVIPEGGTSHVRRGTAGFVALLGGATAWPIAARAQQATIPVIGFLSSLTAGDRSRILPPFARGLEEAGFADGRNVKIEYRFAEAQYERLPALAAELVRQQVTVIAAISGTPAALAAKAATTTIPIVFAIGFDPVRFGLSCEPKPPTRKPYGRHLFQRRARGKTGGTFA